MRRFLLLAVLTLILAGWLGTLISRDPGYVLIAYDGALFQTSLWVSLFMLISGFVLLYLLIRFVSLLFNSRRKISNWWSNRQEDKAQSHTMKGLSLLQEGNYERAEKFLISGARRGDQTDINFLNAAKAADARGDKLKREEFLRLAEEVDGRHQGAVKITRAEIAANREEWSQVIEHLSDVGHSPVVIRLLKDAYLQTQDWEGLFSLLGDIRKMDPVDALKLEKTIALSRLADSRNTLDTIRIIIRKLTSELRSDGDVALAAVEALEKRDAEKEAESLLRDAIEKTWDRRLLETYGDLGKDTIKLRVKRAKGWQKKHPDDAFLLSCLGELARKEGRVDDARVLFENSLQILKTARASHQLGELHSFDGNLAAANDLFRQALRLKEQENRQHHKALRSMQLKLPQPASAI